MAVQSHARNKVGQPFHRRNRPAINRALMQKNLFFGPFSIENGLLPDRPRNLSALNPRQRDAIAEFAKENSKEPAENEDFARFTLYLASWAKADGEACWVAAILREAWNGPATGKGESWSPNPKSPAKEFLLSLRLSQEFVEKVEGIVAASNSESAPGTLGEEQVLWEAVNIQKMGAYGFETKLLPMCKKQTEVPPREESYVENALYEAARFNIPYRKATEAYRRLEPQFKIPLLVRAIAESSEIMRQSFKTMLEGPQGD